MARPSRPVERRRFLKEAAAGAAALVGAPALAQGQQGQEPASPRADVYTTDKPGSDFMADVLKSLDFEYVAANPGSSFRGIHESLINYGGKTKPELLTFCPEQVAVPMDHGYGKAERKPFVVMADGTGGTKNSA